MAHFVSNIMMKTDKELSIFVLLLFLLLQHVATKQSSNLMHSICMYVRITREGQAGVTTEIN